METVKDTVCAHHVYMIDIFVRGTTTGSGIKPIFGELSTRASAPLFSAVHRTVTAKDGTGDAVEKKSLP